MKYRKKPMAIDAWRWLFTPEQDPDPGWVRDGLGKWPETGGLAFEPDHPDGPRICIATLEGVMVTRPGDWIVRGIAGELYSVRDEIFRATYEPEPEMEVS